MYIRADDADSFLSKYRADPNAKEPNVVLRVVDEPIAFDGTFAPPIVALVDLLDAADTRSAAEALRVLR